MALHRTIDPEKAVRWERAAAVRSLVQRLAIAAALVAAGVALLRVGQAWLDQRDSVVAEVTEQTGPDGQATIRYTDPSGTTHTKRLAVGQVSRGERVTVRLPHDAPDEPMPEGSATPKLLTLLPWVLVAAALVPLAGVPSLVVRVEKSGRARKVLGTPPMRATFDYHRDQAGRNGNVEYKARIAPKDDVWKERTVLLGKERPPLDPTDSHDVEVIGEVRGTEPLIVVGESWSLVVLR